MIATLIKKGDNYICSNCRTRQLQIKEKCNFCEFIFSNYEEVIYENWKIINQDDLKGE